MGVVKNHNHCEDEPNINELISKSIEKQEREAEKIFTLLIPKKIRVTHPEELQLEVEGDEKQGWGFLMPFKKTTELHLYFQNSRLKQSIYLSIDKQDRVCSIWTHIFVNRDMLIWSWHERLPILRALFRLKKLAEETVEIL